MTKEMTDFDQILVRSELSTSKWEFEIERTGDSSLLCFGTADMDFKSAPPILAAMERILKAGHFGYPYKQQSYYDAILGFYLRKFGWAVSKEWILGNVGIFPSMQPLIEELTLPGDEIIYQPPVHFIFKEVIESAKRKPLANPLICRDGRYEMDFKGLEKLVSPRTKMLLLCSPHNPVGRVWSRNELMQLQEFCISRNIIVVADEVYCGLLYRGVEFTPMASLSTESSMNTATLMSASKSFNLTGLKHSFVIIENENIRKAYMDGLKRSNLYYGGSIFGHAATEVAMRDCDSWSDNLMDYIQSNYEFTAKFFQQNLPEFGVTKPEATYLVWLDFSKLGLSGESLREFFEKRAHVIVTYGESLGTGGEGHIRFNIGAPRALIERGLQRIAEAYRAS